MAINSEMLVGLFLAFDETASVLLGSTLHPAAEISLPRYETSCLKKLHFGGLILMPCFLSRCSTNVMWSRCSSNVFEKIRRSSEYGIAKLFL